MSRKIIIPEDELRRLYEIEGLTQRQIGPLFGCGASPVADRMREFGIRARTNAQAVARSKAHAAQRRPFTGDEFERGYLCGFCKGDTHVSLTGPGSETIVVRSGSTRPEQVVLFRQVFEPFSHIWESKPDKRGAVNQAAFLDSMSQVVFSLESCDRHILTQLYELIQAQGIECPPPRITKLHGSPRSDRGMFARDYWCLGVYRRGSLIQLLQWLKPHLRHAKRQRDLALALAHLAQTEGRL
jgi:hypothetical protein